jgi:hypothetical protein
VNVAQAWAWAGAGLATVAVIVAAVALHDLPCGSASRRALNPKEKK